MKVLIVSGGKPTQRYPLNGNFEFDQAVALASIGLEVYYFAIDLRSIRRWRKIGVTYGIEKKVKWFSLSIPLGAVPLSILCNVGGRALCFLFSKVFSSKELFPDIIHAHFTEIGNIAAVLSMKTGIPLVITEHSSKMNTPDINPKLLKVAISGYTKASALIAVSKALAHNIILKTGCTPQVVPNLINMKTFTNCKPKAHIGFNLVSVGGLVPGKRFDKLIEAVSEVVKVYKDVKLHIIGDGYLRGELETMIRNLRLIDNVILYGYKNAKEITQIYEISDCFVLPSASETFGVVYVEAMAAGLPVIATRCGGPEDFVNNQNGLLVDVDNSQQLCASIIKMKESYADYSHSYIRQYAIDRFSPIVIANKLNSIYKSILR